MTVLCTASNGGNRAFSISYSTDRFVIRNYCFETDFKRSEREKKEQHSDEWYVGNEKEEGG